jgi:hypothetical protein
MNNFRINFMGEVIEYFKWDIDLGAKLWLMILWEKNGVDGEITAGNCEKF